MYDSYNLSEDVQNFIEWYEGHDRKVSVKLREEYGTNVSELRVVGNKSYELDLATYGPTDILNQQIGEEDDLVNLNLQSLREIRQGKSQTGKYVDGRYSMDFARVDDVESSIFFNIYDNFMSGQERILNIVVPKDPSIDFLRFSLEWDKLQAENLLGQPEIEVKVNDELYESGTVKPLHNLLATDEDTYVTIGVRIHYDVDYNKREYEEDYKQSLKTSGVKIWNIKFDSGIEEPEHLTYGQYVNEQGISSEVRETRLEEFWRVSRYWRKMSYQTVLESSLKNKTINGLEFANNYSSGDMYADMFLTKSALDTLYDTNI